MSLEPFRGWVPMAGGAPQEPSALFDAPSGNLRFADWLYRSKAARRDLARGSPLAWVRVAQRGLPEALGGGDAGFWNNGGAAVKGYATAGITGSATGKAGASYGWWASFLHNFVVPDASWIAKLIAVSEFAIGLLLIVGLFTGAAALAGVGLNLIYMFSGTAGVNPAYALVGVFLILAWRNAGYLGLDRYALPMVRHLFIAEMV